MEQKSDAAAFRDGMNAFLAGSNAAFAEFYKNPVTRDLSAAWLDWLYDNTLASEGAAREFAKAPSARLARRAADAPVRKAWSEMESLAARWRSLMLEGMVEVARTPRTLVARRGPAALYRYSPRKGRGRKAPVFMVYAMIGRPTILDLLPDISVIRRYLDEGIPVYLLDWGVPGAAEAKRPILSFLTETVDPLFDEARRMSRVRRMHLFGYCQGGVFALMYAALFPRKTRSLTLLATPVDFTPMLEILRPWSDPDRLDAGKAAKVFGNIPGELIQFAFGKLQPMRAAQSQWAFACGLADGLMGPAEVERHLAVERWVAEVVPHPARAFKEFVEKFGWKGLLAKNRLHLGRTRVDLRRITCPLLAITGDQDHLVPAASSEPALRLASSKIKRQLRFPAGHVGLSIGLESHERLWPEAVKWMVDR